MQNVITQEFGTQNSVSFRNSQGAEAKESANSEHTSTSNTELAGSNHLDLLLEVCHLLLLPLHLLCQLLALRYAVLVSGIQYIAIHHICCTASLLLVLVQAACF